MSDEKKLEQSNERADSERMMQDHIRLCGALGVDADAHIDMLAEAAERLRAENERLAGLVNMLETDTADAAERIAKLEAALRDARYLLENHASEKHVLERIAAVLKGDAFRRRMSTYAALKGDTSEIRRRASPDDKHPEDRIVH